MAKPKLDLTKKTMNFITGDFEKIAELYPELEPSTVIREIIHQHIEAVEAQVPVPSVSINMEKSNDGAQ